MNQRRNRITRYMVGYTPKSGVAGNCKYGGWTREEGTARFNAALYKLVLADRADKFA